MFQTLKKRLKTFVSDPRGSLGWYLIEELGWPLNEWVSTLLCRINGWFWGVKLGPKVRFRGLAYFKRYPLSKIEIGANCLFLSAKTANPLGIPHPCRLITWNSKQAEVVIGENCGFSGVTIGAHASVRIGHDVLCGPNTTIFDCDGHPMGDELMAQALPVSIEDHVWLGMNCLVLKGVTIGHHSVIGANSVVTHSLPPYSLAAGSPARVLRSLAPLSPNAE